MIAQLFVSTVIVLTTAAMHGAALALFGTFLREEGRDERAHHVPVLSARSIGFTLLLVIGLFVLHGIEIWLYAFVFLWLDAIKDLETAVYFSTISYAGIGYSDAAIDPVWRLVGAIEGINGLLLLGWSTAFFVGVVTRFGRS